VNKGSEEDMMTPGIIPPFTEESALAKVQMAEDLWNTCDPERVVLAYTEDSACRNRAEFLKGREEIRAFLRRKWLWYRSYGVELWEFNEEGLMQRRIASINDTLIEEIDRRVVLTGSRETDVAR